MLFSLLSLINHLAEAACVFSSVFCSVATAVRFEMLRIAVLSGIASLVRG